MKSVARLGWVSAALIAAAVAVGAQSKDPRVGLKPGLRDAGEAAKGMEKIASLFKPEGFFDPKVPAGTATPPERDPSLPPLDPERRRIRGSRTCSRSPTPISPSAARISSSAAFMASTPTTSSARASRS